jgi:CRISPR-associated protein Cmr6
MRTALVAPYRSARDAHPGLLAQRGYPAHDEAQPGLKAEHIARLCHIPPSDFYRRAYDRWVAATADFTRFAATILRVETRLFIGLNGSNLLETGCALQHSYGMPYLPGSSIKGIVTRYVRATPFGKADPRACDELFGAPADPQGTYRDGLAGIFSFHDAWWVPGSATHPLVEEVVTTHHPDYFGQNGATFATDFDSPIPNGQIAVRGSFLFTLEGPSGWLALGLDMLEQALTVRGIGAKTRAGYGVMAVDAAARQKQQAARDAAARQAEAERQAQAAAQAQAAEAARREGLSPAARLLEDLTARVQVYRDTPVGPPRTKLLEEIKSLINNLIVDGQGLGVVEERAHIADRLAATYDRIGWADPGERKKREKQEHKRRQQLDALRQGGK